MGGVELLKIVSSAVKRWKSSPGKAITVVGKGRGKQTVEAEVYTLPGVFSRPVKDARGVLLEISGRQYAVVIATHDFRLSIDLEEGETTIYSQDSSGDVQARIDLDAAGKVKVSNAAGKSLKTILTTLTQHVRDLTTTNAVVGVPCTLSPASIALLNSDIAELGALLK